MKIFKKLKEMFKKQKLSSYDEYLLKSKADLSATLQTLNQMMYKQDDEFIMTYFLENKIEGYLNSNLYKYFSSYYGGNKLSDIIKQIMDDKLKIRLEHYFNDDVEKQIKEEMLKFSTYDIRSTKSFEKFFDEYLNKNKIDIVMQLHNTIDTETFTDILANRLGDEISDMVQTKLKSCSY